jgi:hypothetical protein
MTDEPVCALHPPSFRILAARFQATQRLCDAPRAHFPKHTARHSHLTRATIRRSWAETANIPALERRGQLLDDACTGIGDPAEVLAASVRISGRLCWAQPEIAKFLVGARLEALDAESGWRHARDGISRRASMAAASTPPALNSRSARWPAACSACYGSAWGTLAEWTRRPSTGWRR